SLLAPEELQDPRCVLRRDLDRPRHPPLPFRRLLLQDVAGVGAAAAPLAGGGLAKPLLGAGMGFHLRHTGSVLKQTARGETAVAPVPAGSLPAMRVVYVVGTRPNFVK